MKDDFKRDASGCLDWFYSALFKKANRIRWRLSEEKFDTVTQYLYHLQLVARDVGKHCNPQNFNETMQKIGFDVQTDYSLFNLNKEQAQRVYDILICARDYMYNTDEQFGKTGKFAAYKYKSEEDAVEAMRQFKSDIVADNTKTLFRIMQFLRQSVKERLGTPVK